MVVALCTDSIIGMELRTGASRVMMGLLATGWEKCLGLSYHGGSIACFFAY